ncbi:MAG: oligosaccharide flippase family protein [Clostridia bacterium]|nr:oligosaccharide flippase family protein [Clostridia bacterium]
MKSIFKAVAVVTIFSVITRTLGFFFRIFLTRKLGAEGLGLYQMASSILGVFMTLIASGLPLSTAKSVSKYVANNQLKERNKVVTTSLVIALVVATVSSLLLIILKSLWGIILADNRAVELIIIMIPSILASAVYAVFRGALWGDNNFFACGLTELLEQIIRFVLTIIMLNNITDCFEATKLSSISFNITCIASAIITMFIYLKNAKFNFSCGEYKNILKSAVPITGVRLANSLVQPITTLIIPAMLLVAGYTQAEAISSFGVVMGMTIPLLYVPMTITGSISMVLIPSISSMLAKNEFDSIQTNVNKSLEVSIFLSMMFLPLYLSVGDLIGIILYNNQMSGVMLQLGAICMVPLTLCNLTGSILDALNMEVKSFVNYIIGAVVLIVSLCVLTPLIGINSVIISFFLHMTTISLLNYIKIKKIVPNLKLNILPMIAKYALIILPCSLLGHFVSNITINVIPMFFACVVGGGIAMFSTLLLIYVFKIYDFSDLLSLLKRKKKIN